MSNNLPIAQTVAHVSSRRRPAWASHFTTVSVVALSTLAVGASVRSSGWSEEDKAVLQDLRWSSKAVRPDPSNRFADDVEAARLGQRFFFDTRFSANGKVSCATCHDPSRAFQDGTPLARGMGTTGRRTMPIADAAESPFLFWDGRADSLWSQALGPLESEVEHGGDRVQYAKLVASAYGAEYEAVFGALPDLSALPDHASPRASDERWDAWMELSPQQQDAVNRVFVNVGKAIAAYERKLVGGPGRFDRYVDAVLRDDAAAARELLNENEVAGLSLFIGKASCTQCHNGPRLTNDDFANTGVPHAPELSRDVGRELGAREALQDEFNCLGRYSDARADECRELNALALDRPHGEGAFKVPSLRSVAERSPYMHAGQLVSLEDVIEHYDQAPRGPVGDTELLPLGLSHEEKQQLVAFLRTLSSPLVTDPSWLHAPGAR